MRRPLTGAVVPPSETTIRRFASGVDAQALEAVVAAGTASQLSPVAPNADRVAVAVDGKTVPGARVGGGAAPHLLSAATHDRSLVLAQRQVPSKTNRISIGCGSRRATRLMRPSVSSRRRSASGGLGVVRC